MERTIKEVSVEGVKMRRKPAKHVVYAVKTTWSDGQVNVVSRRYSEFFDLMKKLVEAFPVEGGKNSKERIIPTLQAKRIKFLGKNVMKKLDSISSFTKGLFRLPQEISQSQIVHDFFKPTQIDFQSSRRSTKKRKKLSSRAPLKKNIVKEMSITGPVNFEEYHVIEDMKKQSKIGLDLKKGQVVEVIEKHETGWWLVSADGEQAGWAPASYLSNEEKSDASIKYKLGHGEIYVSMKKYQAEQQDELSFDVGVHLQIIEKHPDGWWKALYCGFEGMVPCTHLKLIGQMNKQETPSNGDRKTPRNETYPEREDETQDSTQIKNEVIPMARKDSQMRWSSDIDEDILKKLRDSILPSQKEENNESTKKKNQLLKPRARLSFRTSAEGGWVPQKLPRYKAFGHNRLIPIHAKSRQSFSFLTKSMSNEEEDRHKSCIALHSYDNTSDNSPKMTKKLQSVSDGNNLEYFRKKKPQRLPAPQPFAPPIIPNATRNLKGVTFSNDTSLRPEETSQTPLRRRKDNIADIGWKARRGLFKAKMNTTVTSLQQSQVPRQMSEESQRIHMNKQEKPRSSSCPDLSQASLMFKKDCIFNTKSTLDGDKNSEDKETSQTLWRDDVENNPRNDESSRSSSEESLVTFQDLEEEIHSSVVFSSSDSEVSSHGPYPGAKNAGKVYIAIGDFKGSKEVGEVDLFKDQQVLVLEKTSGGWWYVEAEQRGWAPSNFLEVSTEDSESEDQFFTYRDLEQEKKRSSLLKSCRFEDTSSSIQGAMVGEVYVAIADFKGLKSDGEADLFENEIVRVLEKTSGGWWLVEGRQVKGWAPSNFLEETSESQEFRGDATTEISQSASFDDYYTECREVHDLKSLQLTKGSRFEVIDTHDNGHFVLVRIPSKVGWIPVSSSTASVNLRK